MTSTDAGSELLAEIGALEVERDRIEARIAERMLCYADVVRREAKRHDDPVDPAGRVLDIAELGRFPSERLRLGVQARDGTCAFSTCSRPADLCDLDHEIAHPRGPTSGSNLRPLCRRHHRLKTHGPLPRPAPPSLLEHRLARVAVDWVAA